MSAVCTKFNQEVYLQKNLYRISCFNFFNYKQIVNSYFEEINARQSEYKRLFNELENITRKYQNGLKNKVPPQLCRKIAESKTTYLNRCYKAGGYFSFSNSTKNYYQEQITE